MLPPNTRFIASLMAIVGEAHVLVGDKATRPYRRGFRCGDGKVLAVLRPGSLIEQWQAVNACVDADIIIIMQAANTGLTGGSTPAGEDYDRGVVIINTLRLTKIHVIDEGRQVICLPGATLYQLEKSLEPYEREPHSVIGSSCIGASVMGGICNNSGGALIRRGPAYTQMALFARLDANRRMQLVNHLGVRLGKDAKEVLDRLERGTFAPADIEYDPNRCGSDHDYAQRLRDVEANVPVRFNADPRRLFEASGSAGKIIVFAVRLDTFPKDLDTKVFYIGTRDPAELSTLRRHVLATFRNLPVTGEYLHRDLFDVAAKFGKDTFLAIQYLGTAQLPRLFRLKRQIDSLVSQWNLPRLASSDQLFQAIGHLLPNHLPSRMKIFRDQFEHHLILKMAGAGITEAANHLGTVFPSASGDFFECTPREGARALMHRFVAAGSAMRYHAIHHAEIEDVLALDVALRPNDCAWFESLPDEIRSQIHLALYYGHFFCHVFHQDYLVRKGCDVARLKDQLLDLLDKRGAQYPAEHNVGHLYRAKPALADFYRSLDPCNQFNPGIGQTSKSARWQ
jgi:D-lactate dehydrogenase (quinone)